jgi:prepilin-type N-terminal cleavage/methylation domain-containing protein
MTPRAREEDGFGMIELLAAIMILSIALLALMAGYDSAFVSLHSSAQKSTAVTLGNGQLELYRSLPYASVGLDDTTTQAVGASTNPSYDSRYATNALLDGDWSTDPVTGLLVQAPSGTVNDVTFTGCGSSPQCLPIQTVTGSDGHHYRLETFIRDRPNSTGIRWTERVVTVIVRDASLSALPEIVRISTAFDRGP